MDETIGCPAGWIRTSDTNANPVRCCSIGRACSAGGIRHAGLCWYAGGYGQSCDAVCSGRGGVWDDCKYLGFDTADCFLVKLFFPNSCSECRGSTSAHLMEVGGCYSATLTPAGGTPCDWRFNQANHGLRICACNE